MHFLDLYGLNKYRWVILKNKKVSDMIQKEVYCYFKRKIIPSSAWPRKKSILNRVEENVRKKEEGGEKCKFF